MQRPGEAPAGGLQLGEPLSADTSALLRGFNIPRLLAPEGNVPSKMCGGLRPRSDSPVPHPVALSAGPSAVRS